MKILKSLIAGSALLLLSSVVAADNPFARAEIGGAVTSVFPEAGVIMIDGARYTIAADVLVLDNAGNAIEGGVKALQSGMKIQYGFSSDGNNPGVAYIIVE